MAMSAACLSLPLKATACGGLKGKGLQVPDTCGIVYGMKSSSATKSIRKMKPKHGPVQTEQCPVCRTVHDKPLCAASNSR